MPHISNSKLYDNLINNLLRVRTYKKIKNILWEQYYTSNAVCTKRCAKGLKILILNAPCNGFGDLIFALKLFNYLRQWYSAEVTLATTYESGLLKLGANPKHVVGLVGGKKTQCRRFKSLKLNKKIPKQDLIFVAPVQIDFTTSVSDVKYIIPNANIMNTFFFSEYNDLINKDFTFHTGIGKGRDGILLTKYKKRKGKIKGLHNPYSVIYVAGTLHNVDRCILAFIEMIAKKYYKKYIDLDIVVPNWFVKEKLDSRLRKKISKYYPTILIKEKDNDEIVISEGDEDDNILTFRCDILPLPNDQMMHLIYNSIDDILLTGDQSITDALSCCSNKNIFYQIAPWKRDLAKNLSKELPNSYLKSVKTSCGTLKAIRYKSNYKKFIKKWDFKIKAKKRIDAIVLSIIAIKKDKKIKEVVNIIDSTKSLKIMKNKLRKIN